MATVTKKKKVQEMLNSPEVIDTSCDMNLPIQEQMVEKKYKCTCCGESWDKRTNHFAKTASPLFQSNGGYLPICNKCRDRYYAYFLRSHLYSQEQMLLQHRNLKLRKKILQDRQVSLKSP